MACALAGLWIASGCSENSLLDPIDPATSRGAPRVVADGVGLAMAGGGLYVQPVGLPLTIPVTSPDDILSAELFWASRDLDATGDTTLAIDGTEIVGTLISEQNVGGPEAFVHWYRYDMIDLVAPGTQSFLITGYEPGGSRQGGIALVVLYRDPTSPWSRIHTFVPAEHVHGGTPGSERGAVWNVPIRPSPDVRLAKLTVVAANCEVTRPDRIWWGSGPGDAPVGDLVGGGSGAFDNFFRQAYGWWLDIFKRQGLVVPAGAGHFAYQLESPGPDGDDILHLFGAVAIEGDDPCRGVIGDRVWHDENGDGLQDAGEPGLAGVTVTLSDGDGVRLESTTTGSDGTYLFADLCAGEYAVGVETPDGFTPAPCDVGDDDATDGECAPAVVTLEFDDAVEDGCDFGFVVIPEAAPRGCFRGAGFWTRELAVRLGDHGGAAHYSSSELGSMLERAGLTTTLDYGGADGVISPVEAYAILSPPTPRSTCEKARRHHMALLLNWETNSARADIRVDTDGDGVPDADFRDALDQVEALLAAAASENSPLCAMAKDIAEWINEQPDDDCRDDDLRVPPGGERVWRSR